MRENGEDWKKQLYSVLTEIYGLHHMFGDELNFLILLTKLEGLIDVNDFKAYRASVFSILTCLTEMSNSIEIYE